MKISNSKKQLAKIIHENGGWHDGAEFAAQDRDGKVCYYYSKPSIGKCCEAWGLVGCLIACKYRGKALPNWHQTILSRDEYFYLYPVPDADGWIKWGGGECPVDGDELVVCKVRSWKEWRDGKAIKAKVLRWHHTGGIADIIAYRLHKPEKSLEGLCGEVKEENKHEHVDAKPTIEQLAADYRNAKDYAQRKQEEADAAKADAEAKLAELVAAGKALGLALSVTGAESGPEQVIIDWRDLQVDDLIWYAGDDELSPGEYHVMEIEAPDYEGYRTVRVNGDNGGHWIDIRAGWGFIRRP